MSIPSLVLCALVFLLSPSVHSQITLQENQSQLRCCTIEESPFVIVDPNVHSGFRGIAIDYLRYLQEEVGFTCSQITLSNLTFSAFIDDLHSCTTREGTIKNTPGCNCDIGVAGFFMNDERYSKVDFLPEFSTGQYRVVTQVTNARSSSKDGWFFLRAFSVPVWLLIATLALAFSTVKLFDKRFAPIQEYEAPSRDMPLWRRCRHFCLKARELRRFRLSVGSVCLKLIGQDTGWITGDHASARARILNFFILFCGLFLLVAFDSATTASLVQESFVSPFRTINDFKCGIPHAEICVPHGGAEEQYFRNSIASEPCSGIVKEGAQFIEENGDQNPYDRMVSMVASGECKYGLASEATLKSASTGRYCGKIILTGDPFFRAGASFVLPKHSPLTEEMSRATLKIISSDRVETVDEFIGNFSKCDQESVTTLTLSKLRYFFVFAFSICGILLLEMMIDPQTESKNASESSNVCIV